MYSWSLRALLSERLARFDDAVLDRGIHAVARKAVRGARSLALFDDRGLDAAVTATARAGVRAASVAAAADTSGVDAAVEAAARTARRLGSAARRPQTGRLHQYYAQITVVLAVAVVLLLVVR